MIDPAVLIRIPLFHHLSAGAVRELTDRIAEALRSVTLNLESWEDRPLVETAVRVVEAERGITPDPAERVARLEVTTRILAEVRRTEHAEGTRLARDLEAYRRRLQRLRLRPADLVADVRLSRGVFWAARRLHLLLPAGLLLAMLGNVLFWLPYQVTALLVNSLRLPDDVRSTWNLLAGIVIYALWVALLGVAAGLWLGWPAAVLCVVLVPVIGVLGLLMRERWRHAWSDARRFFLLRSRGSLVAALRERQRDLHSRLNGLFDAFMRR